MSARDVGGSAFSSLGECVPLKHRALAYQPHGRGLDTWPHRHGMQAGPNVPNVGGHGTRRENPVPRNCRVLANCSRR